jgi:hypothetical protein
MAKHMVLTYLHQLDPEDLPLKFCFNEWLNLQMVNLVIFGTEPQMETFQSIYAGQFHHVSPLISAKINAEMGKRSPAKRV